MYLAEKRVEDIYYLAPRHHGEGRAQSRQVRPHLRHLLRGPSFHVARRVDMPGIPEEWLVKLAEALSQGREDCGGEIEAMGWDRSLFESSRQGAGGARRSAHGAARNGSAPPATSPYGAYGYNSPGRHPHRPRRQPQFPRGEGLGQTRIP